MPPQHSTSVSFDSVHHAQVPAASVSRRSLEAVSVLALFVTLVAAVVIFTPGISVPMVTTKTYVLAAGALITLALYILARLSRGNVILPPLMLVGGLWLPPVAYALSAAFSGVSFSQALWGSMLEADTFGFMLAAAGIGTLTALALRRTEQYRSFLRMCIALFALLVVFQAATLVIGQFAPSVVAPTFSVLGSLEDLAYLLGLGVIAILVTLRFIEVSTRAYRALVGVGVLALALLAVANIAFVWTLVALVALGLFVEAVMLARDAKGAEADLDEAVVVEESGVERGVKGHSLVLPLAVLAISLFFLIGGNLGNALANTFHVQSVSVRPSWQSTFSIARNIYSTSPVFGTGPGTFGMDWLKYRDASLNSTVFWNLNFTSGIGYIPTSLVTTGLLGAVAWLFLFAGLIWLGIRTLILRAPQDSFARYVAILSFVAAIYLFAVALFNVPNAVIVALAFVFAGLFASVTRFAGGAKQRGIIFARSPRIGFVIVFSFTILLLGSVVAAYTLVEHYLAVAQLSKANTAYAAGDLDTANKAAESSLIFAPSPIAYQFQAGVANTRLTQIINSTTLSRDEAQQSFQTTLTAGINAALTATRIDPTDYQSWLLLGNLYAQAVPLGVSGAYDGAKSAYDKAAALNPTNPQIPFVRAQLNIANKDAKAAKEDLKTAIALKQDYLDAIFLLSQLEVSTGNVKEALDAALAAAYFAPNDANILFQVGILYAAQNDLNNAGAALAAAVKANPQFANARYFLAAIEAKQGNMADALEQLKAVAAMSNDNATAVASYIATLEKGKNPFPANLFTSATSTPVK